MLNLLRVDMLIFDWGTDVPEIPDSPDFFMGGSVNVDF